MLVGALIGAAAAGAQPQPRQTAAKKNDHNNKKIKQSLFYPKLPLVPYRVKKDEPKKNLPPKFFEFRDSSLNTLNPKTLLALSLRKPNPKP